MRSVIKGILVTLFATFMMSATLTSCHTQKKIVNQGQIVQQDDKHKQGKPNLRLNKEQRKLLDEAETWLGTPYLYGGQEKGKGAQRESGAFFCGRKRESFTGSFTARRCFSGRKDLRERE